MRYHKNFRAIAGFTLIEMMITMLISSIIMIGVFVAYQTQRRSMANQQTVAAMQQDLRVATILIERDLREAGADPFDPPAGAGIINATSTSVQFTRDIGGDLINPNEGDGELDDPNENIEIRFVNDDAGTVGIADGGGADWDATGSIVRQNMNPGGGGPQTIVNNIDAVEFLYILEDGSPTLNPTGTDLNRIRSVQISMLARADLMDTDFFIHPNFTYTSGSGAPWDPPDDDGFRRRLSIVTVFCRNLEL